MIYEYLCENTSCEKFFEVIKHHTEYSPTEPCPECNTIGKRIFSPPLLSPALSDWGKAEWNPGLGAVTKNAKHRRELAKRKGLEEIGNDYGSGEAMDKHFEKQRNEKHKREWEKL